MKNIRNFTRAISAIAFIAVLITLPSCQKDDGMCPSENNSDSKGQARAANGKIVFRPFSEFIDAQGYNYFAWATGVNTPGGQLGADVDYMGSLATTLALNGGPVINTEVTGTLSEMAMPDGRAKVTVKMSTSNAFSIGYHWQNYPTLDFGYDLSELIADPTLTPALGWAHFTLVFYNTAMGAPIPDVAFNVPFEDFVDFNFHSSSTGPMRAGSGYPEGTMATMKVDMVGLYKNKNFYIPNGTTADGFPVESVTYTLQ